MALFSKILLLLAVLCAVASVTLAGVATPISGAGATGTASATGTTGTTTSNARGALADALADSIRLKAEARKALVEKKHSGGATPQSVPVPAKTKSFAFTNIEIN